MTQSTAIDAAEDCADIVVVIQEELGLHARPAARLAQLAQTFQSEISLEMDGMTVDAKSILDILSLAAGKGTSLSVHCAGEDASLALTAMERFFSGRLLEE